MTAAELTTHERLQLMKLVKPHETELRVITGEREGQRGFVVDAYPGGVALLFHQKPFSGPELWDWTEVDYEELQKDAERDQGNRG